jgi:predicted nucleic acid-binding protein
MFETSRAFNNLYDILKEDISAIIFKFSSRKYFDDIYNILLYYFYFENEVFHGEKLEILIERITNEIFDEETIQEIRNKKNEVENEKKKLEKNTRDIFENTNKTSKSAESNLQRFGLLPKNIQKRSFEPYDLLLNNKNQKVGGFKKNKTNKKKQIKKKNKETKKKNKKTKKTKKNIWIFYTSLAKKNKQTKKT